MQHHRSNSLRILLGLWLGVGILVPRLAEAGVEISRHPNLARGSGPGKVLLAHDQAVTFDKVDAFNGNLSIEIPLGLAYPLSPRMSYQLSLRYNSKVWDYEVGSGGQVDTVPVATSNAGLGWELGFGRLLAPQSPANAGDHWLFVDPGGRAHAFYDWLYANHADVDPGDQFLYSRDGTYLRLQLESSQRAVVEYPGGQRRIFELAGGVAGGAAGDIWRIVRLEDAAGNGLAMTYPDATTWRLTDDHGRQHVVTLRDDPTGAYPHLVESLELTAFGGATAVYQFGYTTASTSRLCLGATGVAAAPMLASVLQPDGSEYRLSYHAHDAGCPSANRLASLTLPTLGEVTWTYQDWPFSAASTALTGPATATQDGGIATRGLQDQSGQSVGLWVYTASLESQSRQSSALEFRRTAQKSPSGHERVFWLEGSGSGYGLPGGPLSVGLLDGSTAHLTFEVFDCPPSSEGCTQVRSVYDTWAQEGSCDPAALDCSERHRRRSAQRIRYHDDPVEIPGGGMEDRFADLYLQDYDGLGHFRFQTIDGNFAAADWRQREVRTNPAAGGFPLSFLTPPTDRPWILDTYDFLRIEDSTGAVAREACFDLDTGQLLRQRERTDPAARGEHDVVTELEWDRGHLIRRRSFGSDLQNLASGGSGDATGDLCQLPLQATPQLEVASSYSHGVLATERFLAADGNPLSFFSTDVEIDPATGLRAAERDSAGLETHFSYDSMGREILEEPEPGHGARTEAVYALATAGGDRAGSTTYLRASGTSTLLQAEQTLLDDFGRVFRQRQKMPDGSWNKQTFYYQAEGWLQRASTVDGKAGGHSGFTVYSNRDPFGRARHVLLPDGQEKVMSYRGVSRRTTVLEKGIYANDVLQQAFTAPLTTHQYFDRRGRLIENRIERSLQPGSTTPFEVRTTHYQFGLSNQMLRLLEDGEVAWEADYDGRGFLVEERFPASGEPAKIYSLFDTEGQAGRQQQGTSDLSYAFDRAGRLVEVASTADPTEIWKRNVYGTDNGPQDWRQGKLVRQERINRFPVGYESPFVGSSTLEVSRTYIYGGVGGRESERIVELDDGAFFQRRFERSTLFSELGQPATVTYPSCTVCGSAGPGPGRQVSYDYTLGWASAIHGERDGSAETWTTSITYHPSGLEAELVYGNGAIETISRDPSGMDRPGEVTLALPHEPLASTGAIVYDATGDLLGVGDRFSVPLFPDHIPEPGTSTLQPEVVCANDPFGLEVGIAGRLYGDPPGEDCLGGIVAYDPDDKPFFRWNRLLPETLAYQYQFLDDRSRPLRDYETTHHWSSTRDRIYLPQGRRLATTRSGWEGLEETSFLHLHLGSTDADGWLSQAARHASQNPPPGHGALTFPVDVTSTFGKVSTALWTSPDSICTDSNIPCPAEYNYVGGCVVPTNNFSGGDCDNSFHKGAVVPGGDNDSCRSACISCCQKYNTIPPGDLAILNGMCETIFPFGASSALSWILEHTSNPAANLLAFLASDAGAALLDGVTGIGCSQAGNWVANNIRRNCLNNCDDWFADTCTENVAIDVWPSGTPLGGPNPRKDKTCELWSFKDARGDRSKKWTCERKAKKMKDPKVDSCLMEEYCRKPNTNNHRKDRRFLCSVSDQYQKGKKPPKFDREKLPRDEVDPSGGGFGSGGGAPLPHNPRDQHEFVFGGPDGLPGSPTDPCLIYDCAPGSTGSLE